VFPSFAGLVLNIIAALTWPVLAADPISLRV
jgi:hypothetical protein